MKPFPALRRRLEAWQSSFNYSAYTGREGLDWRWQVLIFLLCALLVASRRLSLLNHPAFYAEDGAIWYLDAYSFGSLRPLLSPSGGYFNTLPRLVASCTLLAPFSIAPLLMNLAGIAIQVLPVNVLLMSRSSIWGPLPVRALQALVYFILPNVAEIHVVITNAHFHLAVLAFLLVIARPPKTSLGRVLDLVVWTVSGLTGPFCFALLPSVAILWWYRRTSWTLVALIIEAISVLVQGLELFFGRGRPIVQLGASLSRFIRIAGGQVYVGAILGSRMATHLPYWATVLVFVGATGLVLYCLVKARLELRLFVLLSALLLGSALLRPLAAPGSRSVWVALASGAGPRYWFFPMLAFTWCLVWCSSQSRIRGVKLVATTLLLLMIIGAVADWNLPEFGNPHFEDSARRLSTAKEGDLVIVPIFPEGWRIRLEKKGSTCAHPPLSGLNVPQPPVQTSGPLDFSGWISSAEPVRGVLLSVDGRTIRTVQLTDVRPDVNLLWPLAANRLKGWVAHLDLSALTPGPHRFAVRALQEHGCRAEVESSSFVKLNVGQ